MDHLYGLHSTPLDYSDILPSDYPFNLRNTVPQPPHSNRVPLFGSDEPMTSASSINVLDEATSSSAIIKARIASHPRFPRLVQSYIDCHKVGAPPEMTTIFEEIRRDNNVRKRDIGDSNTCFGNDSMLDEFMESYCKILDEYKIDLARSLNEATSYINNVEKQLRNLCQGSFIAMTRIAEESSDEEYSEGERELEDLKPRDEEQALKDELLRRFGSHISSLKLEFCKKKKRGKLPRDARQMLFDWWNAHEKWPYPTEGDKLALAEITGLNPRQINNWFINQRKRHWKPSENMKCGFVNNTSAQYFTED